MKFKSIISYMIAGMPLAASVSNATAQPIMDHEKTTEIAYVPNQSLVAMATKFDLNLTRHYNISDLLDIKARDFCDQYIERLLAAMGKISPYIGKRGYVAAVRQELPGAPVGKHCVYGQTTQLYRATHDMGDTLTYIPDGANRACTTFMAQMRKTYRNQDCISEGKMYPSDSAYNAALGNYLKRNRATSADAKERLTKIFAKRNFSIASIQPGAMLIVPRVRGSKTQFHMITYIGRGIIENGKFIPDESGQPVYGAHNRETLGYLFKTWDTNNVFAVNTHRVARNKYSRELDRIESMSRSELIKYVSAENASVNSGLLSTIPTDMLQKMARDKYFKNQMPRAPQNNMPGIAQNNCISPFDFAIQHYSAHTI